MVRKKKNKQNMVLQWFKEIANFDTPYPHQVKVAEELQKGKSVLLRAPTGSGKTEAVLVPFVKLKGKNLLNKIIYSLPLRVLVEDIGNRATDLARNSCLNCSIHHGERNEDPMFLSDIIITTIDQTIASYACTPLSFSVKHGSIPAGAIATSFLVFDEIQLLDPKLGLQATYVLVKHSIETGFPAVIMTATLPSIFIEKLKKEFKNSVKVIDVEDEEKIPVRKNRRVTLFLENKILTPEEIEKIYKNSDGKMIVVCNTVKKAQELYRVLNVKSKYLLHSRFLAEDRKEIEENIKGVFGKNGKGKGILITTQVIEAGIDISSDLILTEMAPVDSLIQRAGRCSRWGGEGKVIIYEIENTRPYFKEIVEKTKNAIKKYNGCQLTWKIEKSLVDEILNEVAEKEWLNIQSRGNIIALLTEASFEGDRNKATRAIRDELSCEISLHASPSSLKDDVVRLKRIRIPLWTLRKWVKDFKLQIWKVEESNIIDDNMETNWKLSPLEDAENILPFRHYIIIEGIGYDKKLGLIPEPKTFKDFSLIEKTIDKQMEDFSYEKELWVEHVKKVETEAEKILDSYSFEVKKLSEIWGIHEDEFKELILTIIKLHDLGKLTIEWQNKAGWDRENPLAHTGKNDNIKFPPHATVSANAISKWIYNKFNENIGKPLILAIAHHHSLRSSMFKKYCLISEELLKQIFEECNIEKTIVEQLIKKENSYHLPFKFPDFKNPKIYRTYLFVSRILKFADWKATGGEKCPIMC